MPHDCYDKEREIRRRTGIILGINTHSVISELCRQWGVSNAEEFYLRMSNMGDSELKSWVNKAKRKTKGIKASKETIIYA